ncbi:hypothetical protein [Tessaracoccus antarcticus]|uniref:hypothetical protein n=1 Tax=Tessaracoccus antarcticus TaxID=2479848 RepID=UPI0018F535C4|nr:hypothetical protein [Tessaracoccus antarcticus]
MAGVDIMVWLAAGYGLLLLVVAWGIDLAARRTAQRTTAWRSGAFTYHKDHDAWICPEDQWLWPQSFDPGNRVMRYRANPVVCNSCPVKDTCTTSNTGREISRNVDPWPSSEAERFHRGIACCIVVLAMLWPAITLLTASSALERIMLATVLAIVVVTSLPLWSHLRRTPANFPIHVPLRDLDENVAQQEQLARSLHQRRAMYRSDTSNRSADTPHTRAAVSLPTPTVRYTSDTALTPAQRYQPGFPVRHAPESRGHP